MPVYNRWGEVKVPDTKYSSDPVFAKYYATPGTTLYPEKIIQEIDDKTYEIIDYGWETEIDKLLNQDQCHTSLNPYGQHPLPPQQRHSCKIQSDKKCNWFIEQESPKYPYYLRGPDYYFYGVDRNNTNLIKCRPAEMKNSIPVMKMCLANLRGCQKI